MQNLQSKRFASKGWIALDKLMTPGLFAYSQVRNVACEKDYIFVAHGK